MKTVLKTGLCVLLAGCLLSFAACKKKEEPAKPAAAVKAVTTEAAKTTADQPKPAALAAAAPAAAPTTTAPAAASALETVPVADVQAQASKMNVDQLKAKAMEYKNLIMSKKAALEPLTCSPRRRSNARRSRSRPLRRPTSRPARARRSDQAGPARR